MIRNYVILMVVCYLIIALSELVHTKKVNAIVCEDNEGNTLFIGEEQDEKDFQFLTFSDCKVIPMTRKELRRHKKRFYEGKTF